MPLSEVITSCSSLDLKGELEALVIITKHGWQLL